MRLTLCGSLAVALFACDSAVDSKSFRCNTDDDCVASYLCVATSDGGVCTARGGSGGGSGGAGGGAVGGGSGGAGGGAVGGGSGGAGGGAAGGGSGGAGGGGSGGSGGGSGSICNPVTNCTAGCCSAGVCLSFGSHSDSVCGTAGTTCGACAANYSCSKTFKGCVWNNGSLSSLNVDAGALTPGFSSGVNRYIWTGLPPGTSSSSVLYTVPAAGVTVEGPLGIAAAGSWQPVPLSSGPNTISFAVYPPSYPPSGTVGSYSISAPVPRGALAYLKGDSTSAFSFGDAVAISRDGTTIAVGAPASKMGAALRGAVYVYRATTGLMPTVTFETRLDLPGIGADPRYGTAVALSADGTVLAVGSSKESTPDAGVGAVYIYRRPLAGTWGSPAVVRAPNAGRGYYFGNAVALSDQGNVLAVGSFLEDSPSTTQPALNTMIESGAAYVFTHNGTSWSTGQHLKAGLGTANPAAYVNPYAHFGFTVALSGDGGVLAVGANYDPSTAALNGTPNDAGVHRGSVWVFGANNNAWAQQAYFKPAVSHDEDQFGYSVAVSQDGNLIAVGMPFESSNATGVGGNPNNTAATSSGAVWTFRRPPGGAWYRESYIKSYTSPAGALFGSHVAFGANGGSLLVGAPGESSDSNLVVGLNPDGGPAAEQVKTGALWSGAAWVFKFDGNFWLADSYVKAGNPRPGDLFGSNVAMSGDGRFLVVGAYGEDCTPAATVSAGYPASGNCTALTDYGAAYMFH